MNLEEAIIEIHKLVKDPTDVIKIDSLRDTKCGDIPAVPIVPLQGVKDKTGNFLTIFS